MSTLNKLVLCAVFLFALGGCAKKLVSLREPEAPTVEQLSKKVGVNLPGKFAQPKGVKVALVGCGVGASGKIKDQGYFGEQHLWLSKAQLVDLSNKVCAEFERAFRERIEWQWMPAAEIAANSMVQEHQKSKFGTLGVADGYANISKYSIDEVRKLGESLGGADLIFSARVQVQPVNKRTIRLTGLSLAGWFGKETGYSKFAEKMGPSTSAGVDKLKYDFPLDGNLEGFEKLADAFALGINAKLPPAKAPASTTP